MKHVFIAFALFVFSSQTILAQVSNSGQSQNENLYSSVDRVITDLYDSITFNESDSVNWSIFRSLFIDEGKLIPRNAPNLTVWSVEEYIHYFNNLRNRIQSFEENEIGRKTDRFGNIMQVFSTYETRFSSEQNPEGYARGINSIQLIFHQGRWWIASLAWDSERENSQIPEQYLNK